MNGPLASSTVSGALIIVGVVTLVFALTLGRKHDGDDVGDFASRPRLVRRAFASDSARWALRLLPVFAFGAVLGALGFHGPLWPLLAAEAAVFVGLALGVTLVSRAG